MRITGILIPAIAIFLASCSQQARTTGLLCDTACRSDTLRFETTGDMEASLIIPMKDCLADTVSWTHIFRGSTRQIHLNSFLGKDIRIHPDYLDVVIQDTTLVWLTFNDCITHRGYLLKMPFSPASDITKITGALNSFDPRFEVEQGLRAYTDRGSLFVVDIYSGKQAAMTFDRQYDIDFDNIHDHIDSVNISRSRIYAVMLRNGKKEPAEKNIQL